MKAEKIEEPVTIPQGVEAKIDGNLITIKCAKNELTRNFAAPTVKFEVKGEELVFSADKPTKREKNLIFTFRAHINNMIKGVQAPHVYKVKVCSGHFPMTVDYSNGKFTVKNFLGEKVPRVLAIKPNVDVKIDGEVITIKSSDIELAGQVAGAMEQMTRITNKDVRIFQDGIYITKKPRDSE